MPQTAYYIAFGAHGPRALPPPDEGKKVAAYVFAGVGVSLAIFAAMRLFAKPAPHTMNKEWQEASNEYLKVRITLWAGVFSAPKTCSATNVFNHRNKEPSHLPVFRLPITRALDKCRALPSVVNSVFSLSIEKKDPPMYKMSLSKMQLVWQNA